jgi:hypothetical protein
LLCCCVVVWCVVCGVRILTVLALLYGPVFLLAFLYCWPVF